MTHTLVGILVGETAARATPAQSTGLAADTKRNVFVALMALGSNVPDLDFIPSRILDSKLNYLLHHRGHTHTILGALVVALVLYLACEAWCRWRRHSLDRIDRYQIAGIAGLATMLHIALDATNSYGVHPFWPFDNRWYYGDAIFIVEPLFWAACAPLVFVLRSMTARVLVALALLAGVALSFGTGMVPTLMATCLTALTIAMLIVGKLAKPQLALVIGLLVWFTINVAFAQSSATARGHASAIAAKTFPQAEPVDIVLTPMPVNPVCWQVLFVHTEADDAVVRRAMLSIAPTLIRAEDCPSRADVTRTTATYSPMTAVTTASIVWHGEIATSRTSLKRWVNRDCRASAFMRFARAPWIVQRDSTWVIGDARFDHESDLSFAEIELDSNEPCMAYVPPWHPPRADMLSEGK